MSWRPVLNMQIWGPPGECAALPSLGTLEQSRGCRGGGVGAGDGRAAGAPSARFPFDSDGDGPRGPRPDGPGARVTAETPGPSHCSARRFLLRLDASGKGPAGRGSGVSAEAAPSPLPELGFPGVCADSQ